MREKKIIAKAKKLRKNDKKESKRLNQKIARKLRKQAEFHPADKREYVHKVQGNDKKVILLKPQSPREVYKFLKKNKEARV